MRVIVPTVFRKKISPIVEDVTGPDETGVFPFGSVIVGEIYKAKLNESGEVMLSSLGRRLRGDFALIAVMECREDFGANLPNVFWKLLNQ